MRRLLLSMALLASALVAAGCRRAPAPEAGKPTREAIPSARVRFLAMDYDTATSNLLRRQVDAYNETPEGQDAPVDIEIVNWDRGFQKLATLLQGGQAPDLAIIATLWLPRYAEDGVIEPLDSWVKPQFRERFLSDPPLLSAGSVYQGRLYGLPVAVSARALYYNKDILEKAGTQPPRTWDELVAVARKVSRPPDVYGFGVQGTKVETDTYWYYFLWANGGEILDEKGYPLFHRPEGVEALQFVVDLVHRYRVTEPNPTGYDREGLQNLFKQGKLAMMITGPWFSTMLPKEAPQIRFGVVPIPRRKRPGTMAVTDNLVMFRSSPNKEAAWRFVEYFYRTENRLEFDRVSGMLPEMKEVAADPYYQKDPYRKAFMDLLPGGKFAPLHREWSRIQEAVSQAVQAALLQQKSPRQALEDAAAQVRRLSQANPP